VPATPYGHAAVFAVKGRLRGSSMAVAGDNAA
jgi:hypothetical protein